MPTLSSYATTNDGYANASGGTISSTVTTGDNLPALDSSSMDTTQQLICIPFPTAADFSGVTLAQITAVRVKVYINTVVNPSPLGNFGTWWYHINNVLGNGQSTTYSDYTAGTVIYGPDGSPATGLLTITFDKNLLNLSAGTNGGYTNLTVQPVNGGEAGTADNTYIYIDSANKVGGTKAVIEVDYTVAGGGHLLASTGVGR